MPRLALLAAAFLIGASPANAAPAYSIPSAEDAPIAFMYDASSGQVLFERQADRRFMPASVTKAMTTFLAFEWLAEGRIDPRQRYVMDRDTFRQWASVGSTMYLPVNSLTSVDELLQGIAAVSANDASILLAQGAAGSVAEWTAAMNDKAADIGMTDSHFNTPNGWMDDGRTFTTARDLARLGDAMTRRHPGLYARYVGRQEFAFNGIKQYNHDPITGRVDGADGIKTGFTNQAGHGFLGSAERDGRRLIMVVAASPRGPARNRAAREFMEWGFAAFASRTLYRADEVVGQAAVQGGAETQVDLVSSVPIRVSTLLGRPGDVKARIAYTGPLRAPIAAGEPVAELVVSLDGEEVARTPLQAQSAVETAGWFAAARNGILSWLS